MSFKYVPGTDVLSTLQNNLQGRVIILIQIATNPKRPYCLTYGPATGSVTTPYPDPAHFIDTLGNSELLVEPCFLTKDSVASMFVFNPVSNTFETLDQTYAFGPIPTSTFPHNTNYPLGVVPYAPKYDMTKVTTTFALTDIIGQLDNTDKTVIGQGLAYKFNGGYIYLGSFKATDGTYEEGQAQTPTPPIDPSKQYYNNTVVFFQTAGAVQNINPTTHNLITPDVLTTYPLASVVVGSGSAQCCSDADADLCNAFMKLVNLDPTKDFDFGSLDFYNSQAMCTSSEKKSICTIPAPPSKSDSDWAKQYWWVILIIVLVVVSVVIGVSVGLKKRKQ